RFAEASGGATLLRSVAKQSRMLVSFYEVGRPSSRIEWLGAAEGEKSLRHLGRRLVTVFRLLGHHFPDDRSEGARHGRPDELDGAGDALLMVHEFLHERFDGERRLTGEQEIKRTAQAVNIGTNVHRSRAAGLLRGHVIGSADHDAILGQIAA